MRHTHKLFITAIGTAVFIAPVLLAYVTGPDAGKSGVPGESTCTECHTGTTLNGGPGIVKVDFSTGGQTYVPGVNQHLIVTVADTSLRRAGFQLTARLAGNSMTQAGSFIPGTDGFTQTVCASTDLASEALPGPATCPSTQPLQYIAHTLQSSRFTGAGSLTFEFDWSPPSSNVGDIVIYVAGNAANGDSRPTGDHIYTKSFTLTPAAGGDNLTSSLAHIASGGGWKSTISLQNISTAQNTVTVSFFADDGSPQILPYTVTQQSGSSESTGSSLAGTIDPNATLLSETEAPATGQTLVGWARVVSTAPISGFSVFRQHLQNGADSEGTSPLETRSLSDLILPYDSTVGFATGAALVNAAGTAMTFTATIWDEAGAQLGVESIALNGLGHISFVVGAQFPETAGRRGIIEFQNPSGSNIAGLGLRFSPAFSFTSIPIEVRQYGPRAQRRRSSRPGSRLPGLRAEMDRDSQRAYRQVPNALVVLLEGLWLLNRLENAGRSHQDDLTRLGGEAGKLQCGPDALPAKRLYCSYPRNRLSEPAGELAGEAGTNRIQPKSKARRRLRCKSLKSSLTPKTWNPGWKVTR
jgi:hypothetical protein